MFPGFGFFLSGDRDMHEESHEKPEVTADERLMFLLEKMNKNQDDFIDEDELVDWILNSFR